MTREESMKNKEKIYAFLPSGCRRHSPYLWNSQLDTVSWLKTLIGVLHHSFASWSQVADDSCSATTPHVSRVTMLTICRTRGGIYATQTDVRATSVELWLKALGASPSLDLLSA